MFVTQRVLLTAYLSFPIHTLFTNFTGDDVHDNYYLIKRVKNLATTIPASMTYTILLSFL